MITLTIVTKQKGKGIVSFKREIKLYRSTDKARKEIQPIVIEMNLAKKQKRDPEIKIDAVSFDTKSEKRMLLELGAITSVENETEED